ncbi:unnamed protein product, partial [Rotaria socialis]
SSPPPPSSSPPAHNPRSPSTMNSQQLPHTTTSTMPANNIQQIPSSPSSTPIAYATMLNSNGSGLSMVTNNNVLTTTTTSIINGGRQQQYHRPLLRPDETSNTGTLNSYDGKENKRM